MKKIFFCYFGVVSFLFCVSCTYSPNFYSDSVKQIVSSLEETTLKSDTTFQAEMGTINFFVIDDKFIYTVGGRDTLFYVYDKDQCIGAFGKNGRGPDEFMNTIYCGQKYQKGDTIGMWINDMMQQEMKLVDITESIKENKTVLIKKIETLDLGINSFVLNDSAILQQQYSQYKNVNLVHYNPITKRRRTNSFYASVELDPFVVYLNAVQIHPKGDRVVAATCHLNQINIFSLTDSTRIAMTVGEPAQNRLDVIKANWKGRPTTLFYNALEATDKYIFALYMNQPREEFSRKLQPVTIQVWDWEGNLHKCFKVEEYLTRISVDAVNNYLYGFSIIGEKVFRYDLKGIL